MKGGKDPRTQRALHSPVLYTCSSSTIPSLPPPNTTMSSLMATARWPWRGRGTGPDQPTTRFQRGCKSTAGELAGVKGKGEKEGCIHVNAEFQRISRRDKKAFLSDKCKESSANLWKQLSQQAQPHWWPHSSGLLT